MLEIRNCFKLVLTSEDIFNKQNDKNQKINFGLIQSFQNLGNFLHLNLHQKPPREFLGQYE
jgi:hypothetical protein